MDERVTSALSAMISDHDTNEKAANFANGKTSNSSNKLIRNMLSDDFVPLLKKLYPNENAFKRISDFVSSVSSQVPDDIVSLRKEILSPS